MRLFSKKPPSVAKQANYAEAIFPLPYPKATSAALTLPLSRYSERLAHTVSDAGIYVSDYTVSANEFNVLAQRLKPGNQQLKDDANQRFSWHDRRMNNWTETLQSNFLNLIPPDPRISGIHSEYVEWAVNTRDFYYYSWAAKLYYARDDQPKSKHFDDAANKLLFTRMQLSTELLVNWNDLATSDGAFFESLRLPENVFMLVMLEHLMGIQIGVNRPIDIPELARRSKDVLELATHFNDAK